MTVILQSLTSVSQSAKKKLQPVRYMMSICDWGGLQGASNHRLKSVAKLIIEGVGHSTSIPLFLDLVQNQVLKHF